MPSSAERARVSVFDPSLSVRVCVCYAMLVVAVMKSEGRWRVCLPSCGVECLVCRVCTCARSAYIMERKKPHVHSVRVCGTCRVCVVCASRVCGSPDRV